VLLQFVRGRPGPLLNSNLPVQRNFSNIICQFVARQIGRDDIMISAFRQSVCCRFVYTESLLSESFVRFCNEDEVLPTTGGDETSSSLATPSSVESTPPSTSADSDSLVDVCTVRTTARKTYRVFEKNCMFLCFRGFKVLKEWRKALVVEVYLGGRGAMTSRIGHIYQQTSCCSRQRIAQVGGVWSAVPPMFAPANRAPTTTKVFL